MKKNLDILRKEDKFLLTKSEYLILKNSIKFFMNYDEHQLDNGSYNVRSLYFDTPYNRGVYEKEAGMPFRRKIRVRIYNQSRQTIRLETKVKNEQGSAKKGVKINFIEFSKLYRGDYSFLLDNKTPLKELIYLDLKVNMLRPVVFVEYQREAFWSTNKELRVSLDTNIKYSFPTINLFSDNIPWKKSVNHYAILEVKYNNKIPIWMGSFLQKLGKRRDTFSKYYFSRVELNNLGRW